MNSYAPDGWVLLKYSEDSGEVTYSVFGSWSGGYLDGDSWRRNSGIESYTEDEDFYYFKGYSGSVYVCIKGGGRVSSYCSFVVNKSVSNNSKLEFISIEDFIEEFDSE